MLTKSREGVLSMRSSMNSMVQRDFRRVDAFRLFVLVCDVRIFKIEKCLQLCRENKQIGVETYVSEQGVFGVWCEQKRQAGVVFKSNVERTYLEVKSITSFRSCKLYNLSNQNLKL